MSEPIERIPEVVLNKIENDKENTLHALYVKRDEAVAAFEKKEVAVHDKAVAKLISKTLAAKLSKMGVVMKKTYLDVAVGKEKVRKQYDDKIAAIRKGVDETIANFEFDAAVGDKTELKTLVAKIAAILKI